MSYTKEYSKEGHGYFKGAWYYKPWYVRKRDSLPESAQSSGILGPKGMEWPKYPGGYTPTWEERSGVPGLYKPTGRAIGGLPAMKTAFMSGRTPFRAGRLFLYGAFLAMTWYSTTWFRLHKRYEYQLRDEDLFRTWSTASYMQAFCDCSNYSELAKLDMFCREHVDHLPGVHRSFYHQDDIAAYPFHEVSGLGMARRSYLGNYQEKPAYFDRFLTH
eukprot:TRINITY_DN157_c0_g1_i1.p2 TRINITY_DN157_c0_g1~~TRINITY_DN157_c0_g1_i1.p2  ORF type:complete len:216 (+),score=26.20 TRINITY_DN157_c0_g1_i1:128-775(+)